MGTRRKVVGTVAGSQYIIINARHYYILDGMNLQVTRQLSNCPTAQGLWAAESGGNPQRPAPSALL